MQKYKDKIFPSLRDDGNGHEINDMIFENCRFNHCVLSNTKNFSKVSKVENVILKKCIQFHCRLGPAILTNVVVDGLDTSGMFIAWGTYFDRVTLSGNVGKIKINIDIDAGVDNSRYQEPFDKFRTTFYENVEYALDISKAKFKDFDLRGVPAAKVIRDPNTQIVITRQRALEIAVPGWQDQLSDIVQDTYFPFAVDLLLENGYEDKILAVPLAAPKRRREALLKAVDEFRAIGLAEPD